MQETKVYDFDTSSNNFEWERRGRKWLSEILAEHMLKDKVVSIKVKKEGVYCFSAEDTFDNTNEEWKPYVSFVSQGDKMSNKNMIQLNLTSLKKQLSLLKQQKEEIFL